MSEPVKSERRVPGLNLAFLFIFIRNGIKSKGGCQAKRHFETILCRQQDNIH